MEKARMKRIAENISKLNELLKQMTLLFKQEEFLRSAVLDEMRELIDRNKIPVFFVNAGCDKPCLKEGEYFVITQEDISLATKMEAWTMSVFLVFANSEVARIPAPEETYYIEAEDYNKLLIFLAQHPELIEKYKK